MATRTNQIEELKTNLTIRDKLVNQLEREINDLKTNLTTRDKRVRQLELEKMAGNIQLLQDTPAITTNSSWHKSRHLLDTDTRYEVVESDFPRAQSFWFWQYVQQLKRACFIQLLQNTPEITRTSRFHESRRLIITDPRYNVFETDLHRQLLFSQYVEQLKMAGYFELLQDTSAITKDSSWHKSRHLLETDPRYEAVESDYLREQWFWQYVQQLVLKPLHVEQTKKLSDLDKDEKIIQIKLQAEMQESANWIKCVLAQTKTREALVIVVTKSFGMFIKRTLDGEEILNFLDCLKKQNVVHIKNKHKEEISHRKKKKNNVNKSTWNCEHLSCAKFFKTLVEHYIPPQTDEWDIYPKPGQDKNKNKDLSQKHKASTSQKTEAKMDAEYTLLDENLFLIAKLYKFPEPKDEDSCIAKLDISQMIKLQRCCSLFEFDDSARIYDNIITNRNKLMHSINNLVVDKDLKNIFGFFYAVLEAFGKEFDVCVRVLKELREFEKSLLEIKVHDVVRTLPEEAKQALQTKEKALENDISNSDKTRPSDVSYLTFLLDETREEKSNLEKKMKEIKQEIEQVMNKSNQSVQTDLRYVYLPKEVELKGDKDKDKLPEGSDVKIKDSPEKIKKLEKLLETSREEVMRLKLKLEKANKIMTEASSVNDFY